MKPRICLNILSCFLLAVSFLRGAEPATKISAAPTKPQVVLLKFDDVTTNGAHGKVPVSARWQKLADYLAANHLKGSFGIICYSLEKDAPAYFQWIKDVQAAGLIEFWLHGYRERTATDKQGEFEVGTAEEQREILARSEGLALLKLGFPLAAFGPHWSGTTDATDEALAAVPAVKIWLYGPRQPKFYLGLSIERIMALENPHLSLIRRNFATLTNAPAPRLPCWCYKAIPPRGAMSAGRGFLRSSPTYARSTSSS